MLILVFIFIYLAFAQFTILRGISSVLGRFPCLNSSSLFIKGTLQLLPPFTFTVSIIQACNESQIFSNYIGEQVSNARVTFAISSVISLETSSCRKDWNLKTGNSFGFLPQVFFWGITLSIVLLCLLHEPFLFSKFSEWFECLFRILLLPPKANREWASA